MRAFCLLKTVSLKAVLPRALFLHAIRFLQIKKWTMDYIIPRHGIALTANTTANLKAIFETTLGQEKPDEKNLAKMVFHFLFCMPVGPTSSTDSCPKAFPKVALNSSR
jgi:hypothetical protein